MKQYSAKAILIGLIMICASVNAFAQRGEKSLGLMGGYNTYTESGVAGIYFQYRFGKYFRIAPDVQFMIQRNNVSSFTFNIDAQFPLMDTKRINIYPIAGISFQSWRMKFDSERQTSNYIGLNAGAGIEYKVTSTLKLFVEGKYSFIKKYNNGNFVIGIGYCF